MCPKDNVQCPKDSVQCPKNDAQCVLIIMCSMS
jgi:hypothetical protein